MATMPNINISFKKAAQTFSRRNGQGIVAVILLDGETSVQGYHELNSTDDIPSALSAANQEYLSRAFIGNINRPAKVICYILDDEAEAYTDALTTLATKSFDWLVAAPNVDATLAGAVKTWIVGQRSDNDAIYKAVLPNLTADDEAIVNFTGTGIKVGSTTYSTAEYCSRIAGILAGTPLRQSVTYTALSEVNDITRLSKTEQETAVAAGKMILIHDGRKVKIGAGITSLTTVTSKSEQLQKIKIVEALDLIKNDLRILYEDSYIGKVNNNYDGKCLLVTATLDYLRGLESEGILKEGASTVAIDVDAQRNYLRTHGVDVSNMTEQEIKEADTDSSAFLTASIVPLDAIESITLPIEF